MRTRFVAVLAGICCAVVSVLLVASQAGAFGFMNKPEPTCSTGVVHGGYCWHASEDGSASCSAVCSDFGGEVSQGSNSFAGTQGSLDNCVLVANSFPNPAAATEQNSNDAEPWDSCTGDWDCFYGNLFGRRYCSVQTSSLPQVGIFRYCACRT